MTVRVSDFPEGKATLTLVINGKKIQKTGEIVRLKKDGEWTKVFICKKESFAAGTLAMDKDGIAYKSVCLFCSSTDMGDANELNKIIRDLGNHGAIKEIRIIPEEGYELVFNREKLLAAAELVNMFRKKTRRTRIIVDLMHAIKKAESSYSQGDIIRRKTSHLLT